MTDIPGINESFGLEQGMRIHAFSPGTVDAALRCGDQIDASLRDDITVRHRAPRCLT